VPQCLCLSKDNSAAAEEEEAAAAWNRQHAVCSSSSSSSSRQSDATPFPALLSPDNFLEVGKETEVKLRDFATTAE
jgi:hypothetical protein